MKVSSILQSTEQWRSSLHESALQLVTKVKSSTAAICDAIYDTKEWLHLNMLKFNTSKTELFLIGSSNN